MAQLDACLRGFEGTYVLAHRTESSPRRGDIETPMIGHRRPVFALVIVTQLSTETSRSSWVSQLGLPARPLPFPGLSLRNRAQELL